MAPLLNFLNFPFHSIFHKKSEIAGETGDMKPLSHIQKEWIFIFILFGAVLAVYAPSLQNGFVNIDDPHYITENPYIRDFSWKGIVKIFSTPIVGNYFPLQILSYALDYELWQVQPFGYHLTNFLFHFLNVILVFLLLNHIFSDRWISFLSALLFGLHPVNVESVTWISERKNVLSMFFLLLSFLTYDNYLKERNRPKQKAFYLGSLFLFFLSLLAKVSAVVLPLLLLLYEVCFHRRSKGEMLKDKIPFFGLSLLFSLVTLMVYHGDDQLIGFHGGSSYANSLAMINVLSEYIIYLIAPVYLDNYYLTPIPKSFWETQVLLSVSALALIIFLAWRSFKKDRFFFFWAAWFLIALLPVLNIVPINILRADRYMYLPAIGFFYLISRWLLKLAQMKPVFFYRPVSFLGILLAIGSCAYLTLERNEAWKDSFNLWTDNLKKFPDHWYPYNSIGNNYMEMGKLELAITCFKTGLQRNPDHLHLLNSLSVAYIEKGNLDRAEEILRKAIRLYPMFIDARNNLGYIYCQKGEVERGCQEFQKAVEIGSNEMGSKKSDAYNNLGVVHYQQGRWDEAIQEFEKAIQVAPGAVQAYLNLALAYEQKGFLDKAEEYLIKALDYDPQSHGANFHLGRVYFKKRKLGAADYYLEKALHIKPRDADTNFYLGLIANETARFYFDKALKENPAHPQAQAMASFVKGLGARRTR